MFRASNRIQQPARIEMVVKDVQYHRRRSLDKERSLRRSLSLFLSCLLLWSRSLLSRSRSRESYLSLALSRFLLSLSLLSRWSPPRSVLEVVLFSMERERGERDRDLERFVVLRLWWWWRWWRDLCRRSLSCLSMGLADRETERDGTSAVLDVLIAVADTWFFSSPKKKKKFWCKWHENGWKKRYLSWRMVCYPQSQLTEPYFLWGP